MGTSSKFMSPYTNQHPPTPMLSEGLLERESLKAEVW